MYGKDNTIVDVSSSGYTGIAKEYALDCTNISSEGLTQQQYQAILTAKGQEYLQNHVSRETYTGLYTGKAFLYPENFNLGDVVKIQDDKRAFDTNQRVTQALYQYSTNGKSLKLSFGEVQKTISSALSQLYKKVDKIENTPIEASSGGGGSVTLGYGLKYDSNGAICINFDPTINIENAIIVQKVT